MVKCGRVVSMQRHPIAAQTFPTATAVGLFYTIGWYPQRDAYFA